MSSGMHRKTRFPGYRPAHRKHSRKARIVAGAGGIGIAAATGAVLAASTAPANHTAGTVGRSSPGTANVMDAARYYYVQPGDDLTSIAKKVYGSGRYWSGIYLANKAKIENPNMILVGWELSIPVTPSDQYVPLPSPTPGQSPEPSSHTEQTSSPLPQPTPVYQNPAEPDQTYTGTGTSAYQQCVIQAESGGNPQIFNSTGHYGLYQFAYGTWVANGGNSADFGHASVAEQNQVFATTYAADGTQPWESDGCSGSTQAKTSGHSGSATLTSKTSLGAETLSWAETDLAGAPYVWGGNGPGYDCSGLVVAAFAHEGVTLPRTTYEMLASSLLVPTDDPQRGDLVFPDSGHVEFYVSGTTSFGEHESGETAGYLNWGSWPAGTRFFTVR